MNSATHQRNLAELWRTSMQALEWLGIGWLVCDSAGRMLGANQIAESTLDAADGLRLNSHGVLVTTCGNRELLADAAQGGARVAATNRPGTKGSFFMVKRAGGKRALTIFVRSMDTVSSTTAWQQPVVLVLILDPSLPVRTTEEDLSYLYGFTPREAGVATLLMDGHTLDTASHKLGMARSTARTHLRRMFKKTRARRQTEMISVLLKTIGLVRLRDELPHPTTTGGDAPPPAMFRSSPLKADRSSILPAH